MSSFLGRRIVAVPILVFLFVGVGVRAGIVEYDLTIEQKEVDITGKLAWGMTINGSHPGPILRFKEGDFARIRVHNKMTVETSIHWHGVLVPPGMDGVPLVSFPPIEPGTTFTYEFPIRQNGTYWYHSHTGLQEQKGLYGAIVIEPRQSKPKADSDHVILFSDWTDESTHEVLRTLKRGSGWFGIEKGSAQSIIGAARIGHLGSYFKRELMRMPEMDISDIAFDRFLANGEPEMTITAKPGEMLRLRIIDGGAGTNFILEFAGGPMTIVASDGQEVEQIQKQRLFIAIAETYDVLIRVPPSGAHEFRATAQDGSGYASVWIGAGDRHPAPPSMMRSLSISPGLPEMDISDIAFDRFLANGEPEMTITAKPGEMLRLRIIDGGAGTNFILEFAGGPMTIVASDGQEVEQIQKQRLFIAIAETYDVLIRVPPSGAHEFRATAQDGSGYASVWIGAGDRHPAPDVPKPNLYHNRGKLNLKRVFALTPQGALGMPDRMVKDGKFDNPGMMGMGTMPSMKNMSGAESSKKPMAGMDSPSKEADSSAELNTMSRDSSPIGKKYGRDFRLLAADVSSSQDLAIDGLDAQRPWPPYNELRATGPTSFPKDKPAREIRLTLDGDMERYVWFINNKPLSESDMIAIKKGEIVRFIMINRTMMHHPMHLHGHFFRVINDQGDYAPLKHTVDVTPMSTTVIEFDANEFGDWFFHCHLLYHLKGGMARVVHYEGFNVNPQLEMIRPALYEDSWYSWGRSDVLSNMNEGYVMLSNTRNILTAEWEVGWQEVSDTEWEGIFSFDRYINRFFTVFAGVDLLGTSQGLDDSRGVFGFRYLLPLNIETRTWVDTDGGARAILGKSLRLTPRFTLLGEAQFDTHDGWEGIARLTYLVSKNVSVTGQWHSDYGFGGGPQIRF